MSGDVDALYSPQDRPGPDTHPHAVSCCCHCDGCPAAACPSPWARGPAPCGPCCCCRWSALRAARLRCRSSCCPRATSCSFCVYHWLPSSSPACFTHAQTTDGLLLLPQTIPPRLENFSPSLPRSLNVGDAGVALLCRKKCRPAVSKVCHARLRRESRPSRQSSAPRHTTSRSGPREEL